MEPSSDFVFVLSAYGTPRAASQDYQAVKDLFFEINELDQFDAVVVGRQDTGAVKLFKKPEFPTAYDVWAGAGLGLAAGLVTALVPDAVTDTGFLAGAAAGAGLAVAAATIAQGIGQARLGEVGEWLEAAPAALVQAVSEATLDRVQSALTTDEPVLTVAAAIDTGRLTADARAAQQEARGA